MGSRRTVLIAAGFAVLVLTAGCTTPPDQPTTPPKTLDISPPECTAAGHRCTDVRQGEPVRIRWNVEYNDPHPITIPLNEEGSTRNLGFAVLRDFCTVFNASRSTFTATKISPFTRQDVSDQQTVTLEGDQTLRFEWVFRLREGDISRLGAGCTPRFRIKYTHTVNGSRQIQVREHRQVPEVTNLNVNMESATPVKPRIDVSDTYIAGDPIFAEAYLTNRGQGTLEHINYVEMEMTRGIAGEEVNASAPDCRVENPPNRNEYIYPISTGSHRGETSRLRCGPKHGFKIAADELGGQSNVFLLTMASRYTYRQTVGNVQIGVAPSE